MHTDMERRVCHLSRGLAEVLELDGRVVIQLIHQSVQDLRLDKGFIILDSSIAGAVVGHGHLRLLRSCVKYFCIEEIHSFALSVAEPLSVGELETKGNHSLLNHSLQEWIRHASWNHRNASG